MDRVTGTDADRVRLAETVAETLRERADRGAPREVCGVLLGAGGDDGEPIRVTDAVAVPNVASEPRTRYELDPEELLAVVERSESGADGDGGDDGAESVVGFYHSHPNDPPEPSAVDRAAATWPGYVYLIVGAAEVAAYLWTGEAFEELVVEITDGS